MADFNHDGIPDLAVLSAEGVSIYLGDGQGGFAPPVTYDAGPDPTGLTVADVNRRRQRPTCSSATPYGDVLVLLGNGDGTFRPYRKADQAVALAVADLTGDGQPDFVFADQGLDRVVVEYGSRPDRPSWATTPAGLLAPGAVKLADLNGDGIPDLIVANSGSNNVLVYPGLGNGQFGPALNGGHGFFTGTNPAGITVADLNGDGRPTWSSPTRAPTTSRSCSTRRRPEAASLRAGPAANFKTAGAGIGPVATVSCRQRRRPARPAGQQQRVEPRLAHPGRRRRVLQRPEPDDLPRRHSPGPIFVGNFDGRPDLASSTRGPTACR